MTSIRVTLLQGDRLRQGDQALIDEWRRESDDKLWVDIQEPVQEVIEPLLEERFGFHELAAEDTLSPNTLPKYDSFSNYDFFIFRTVDVNLSEHKAETYKIAAFLGTNFLFTVHRLPLRAIDDVRNRLVADRRLLERGPDFLLYSIVDQMVDAHFPLVEQIEEAVDDLQDRIFESADDLHLDELLHLKRDLGVLRRHTLPQRELLNQISRGDARFVQRQHLIYFRDVYDHMFRISETIDVDRDQMTATMDAYLSVVANRTNETMKVLTIFSAIMLPLTLIAGIYGMNFEHMPELKWLHGYPFALGLMIGVAVLMMVWFWRKGWITIPRPHRRRRSL
ncbi:MAG TPA: magnesium/cobalt transporter CorA [Thermoanaerobaculia bacterium]|nr:magnesium/cobalt transporter CorA [Thermoanaerobaculia bacterium]